MKYVVLVNGSLRSGKSSSLAFLKAFGRKLESGGLEIRVETIQTRRDGGLPDKTFIALGRGDAIVLAFPLFSYCLSGSFIAFLENWYGRAKREGRINAGTRVYAIVNCGHAEPEINAEAIRVIANFCRRMGISWRFAVSIGGGAVVAACKSVPLMNLNLRKALSAIAADIALEGCDEKETILLRPPMPKALMFWIRDIVLSKARSPGAAAT
jgi:hypothetical protein